jgi:hypothetical protein
LQIPELVLDGMTGVVAALIAGHDIGPLGEEVDHLALALVAPLGANDHRDRHW